MTVIDCETPPTSIELQMLLDYGWEISEDQHEARLYSEEYTPIQIAVWSTKWWIEENKPLVAPGSIKEGKS